LGDVSARIALANARADLTLVFGIHVFAIERDCARQTEIATFTCRNRRGSRAERPLQLIEHAAYVGILTAHDGQRRILKPEAHDVIASIHRPTLLLLSSHARPMHRIFRCMALNFRMVM